MPRTLVGTVVRYQQVPFASEYGMDDPWVCTVEDRDGKLWAVRMWQAVLVSEFERWWPLPKERIALRYKGLSEKAAAGRNPYHRYTLTVDRDTPALPGFLTVAPELEPPKPARADSESAVDADVVERTRTMNLLTERPEAGALAIIAQDVPVISVRPRSKVPIHARWPELGMLDTGTVMLESREQPDANVGVLGGPLAFNGEGLTIVDVDQPDGPAAFLRLAGVPVQDNATVATPSGGWHVWYRGHTASWNPAPGLEVRSAGRQCAAPPSINGQGRYRWVWGAGARTGPARATARLGDQDRHGASEGAGGRHGRPGRARRPRHAHPSARVLPDPDRPRAGRGRVCVLSDPPGGHRVVEGLQDRRQGLVLLRRELPPRRRRHQPGRLPRRHRPARPRPRLRRPPPLPAPEADRMTGAERTVTARLGRHGDRLVIVERWLDRQCSPPRWRSKNRTLKLNRNEISDFREMEEAGRDVDAIAARQFGGRA